MSETQEKVGADKSDLKVKIKKPSLMKKDKGPIKLDLRKKFLKKTSKRQMSNLPKRSKKR